MRVAVYTDYAYMRRGDSVYAERAFALFLAELADSVDRMVIVGRLRQSGERPRYPLPARVGFVPLPFYETLARPLNGVRAMVRSIGRFWSALDDVDVCWLLGPHPLAIVFALAAMLRRRKVVLGVRQDLVAYARSRHPGRRSFAFAAILLEAIYRGLARLHPVVVVGPALREHYAGSRAVLEIAVSLVRAADLVDPREASQRSYDEVLRILTVGRIDSEKNPLMLADVLAGLAGDGTRDWRLVICGEGAMEEGLRSRLAEFGVAERAQFHGYVAYEEMRRVYRSSHVLLHVSWTEGLPQVIVEALAAGVPVVATDVGGIREAIGDAGALVPPGDAEAAIEAVRRVRDDEEFRRRMILAGLDYAGAHTLEVETRRVAAFLGAGAGPGVAE